METAELPRAATSVRTAAVDGSTSNPCLSNLVIYSEDAADEAMLNETVGQYVVKHPCRVIMIIANPRNSQSKLDAVFSAHTFSDGAGKTVTCEQITLTASGGSLKELGSAIQPLLVADLPINIWWRGLFLERRILVEQMLTYADRFIYDGLTWTNLHYTVLQVADFISRYDDKVGFTNFNWSRLRPWRESAADFFDAGLFEKEIWEINNVRVEYMTLPEFEEGYHFRSLLFVAWLAVQLEWQPVQGARNGDESRLEFTDKKGEPVITTLVLLPQSTPTSQSLQKVVMSVRKPEYFHTFTIERDYKESLVILRHEDAQRKQVLRTVPHSHSSKAELLYRELGRRTRSRVFEKSFKLAAKLLEFV